MGEPIMQKLTLSAAMLALSIGAAAAQTTSYRSTTVQTNPAEGTQTTTTTTENNDGYLQYRKTVTATRRYDAGAFDAPAGYTYMRYTVGDHVPAVLLQGNLALSDYADYQLDRPPQGLEWIRVGDDALLVDPSSGEVVQTDYNLFD